MTPAHSVEWGLGVQTDKRPGDYGMIAAAAEKLGFDVVSVYSDLLFQPPIVALLEMAQTTSRLRLGAACWNPFTMHPYEIAGQLAALDAVSNGRAYLGLARGTWLAAIGIEQRRSVTRLREAVGYIRALLSESGDGFNGEIFTLAPGIRLRYPVVRARTPLLLGAWGPLGAALAGEIADELKVGGSANAALVPLIRERIAIGERRAGREPGSVRLVFGAVTVVDRDGARARQLARREVAMYMAAVAELDPTIAVPTELLKRVQDRVAAGDHEGAGDEIPDYILDAFAFSGTPRQVAEQARALVAAGVDRVEFGTPHGVEDGLEGIRLLGTEVLPAVRSR